METTLQQNYQKSLDNYKTCIYGHKKNPKLLSKIHQAIPEKAMSFIDLFSGTGVVGWSVKHQRNIKILSNDIMKYACLRAKVLVANNGITLTQDDLKVLTRPNPHRKNYIECFYGRFMGEHNYTFLDNWAANIPSLNDPIKRDIAAFIPTYNIMSRNEYCAVTFSPLGTLTGYRNYWDIDLKTECLDYAQNIFPLMVYNNHQKNEVYNEDAVGLLPIIHADFLYIDSPYCAPGGGGEYEPHLAFYDDLVQIFSGRANEIVNYCDHKADLAPYTKFYNRQTAFEGFVKIFQNSGHIPTLLISYNTTSDIDPEELVVIAHTYGRKTSIEYVDYTRPTTQKGNNNKTKEIFLICSYK